MAIIKIIIRISSGSKRSGVTHTARFLIPDWIGSSDPRSGSAPVEKAIKSEILSSNTEMMKYAHAAISLSLFPHSLFPHVCSWCPEMLLRCLYVSSIKWPPARWTSHPGEWVHSMGRLLVTRSVCLAYSRLCNIHK